MIEVHLYGRLRRVANQRSASAESVVSVEHRERDTVGSIVERIGLALDELGSNLFVNGRYATVDTPVSDGDRLGLFPVDMQLLYKWYFAPLPPAGAPTSSASASRNSLGRDTGANSDEPVSEEAQK